MKLSFLLLTLGLLFISFEISEANYGYWPYYRPYYYYRPWYYRPYYRPWYWRYGRSFDQNKTVTESVLDPKFVVCEMGMNDTSMSCHTPFAVVECPMRNNIERVAPRNIEHFGIGIDTTTTTTTTEPTMNKTKKVDYSEHKYNMYPRSADGNANGKGMIEWLNNKFKLDNRESTLTLFYSNKTDTTGGNKGTTTSGDGIQITDLECFKQMIRLFEWSYKFKKFVTLSGSDGKNTTAIFGEILVIR